jgi:hypothetical protein
MVLGLATSLGVALGSFGLASAPAQAASFGIYISPGWGPYWGGPAPYCHIVYQKRKIWRHHNWKWVRVPVRVCPPYVHPHPYPYWGWGPGWGYGPGWGWGW